MRKISRATARKVLEGIVGGWSEVDLEQFRQGLEVELEHEGVTGGDLQLTGLIALDHLRELPDYYTRLKKMEEGV